MNTEFKPIKLGTQFKKEVYDTIIRFLSVTLTTVNPDGKTVDHTFYDFNEAFDFIDEFYRTASREEEIYTAQ